MTINHFTPYRHYHNVNYINKKPGKLNEAYDLL